MECRQKTQGLGLNRGSKVVDLASFRKAARPKAIQPAHISEEDYDCAPDTMVAKMPGRRPSQNMFYLTFCQATLINPDLKAKAIALFALLTP